MPIYDVEHLDKTGKQSTVTVRAENEDVVVKALHTKGLHPMSVKPSMGDAFDLDANVLAAEADEQAQRLAALNAKVEELQRRFDGGDDSAYAEMVALARLVANEEAFDGEVRRIWQQQLDLLQGAGSAQGLRERKGFSESKGSMLIVKGTVTGQGMERTGEFHLLPGSGFGFRSTDPATGNRSDFETLVRFRDVKNIRMRGLFKKRMEIESTEGRTWEVVPDKDTNPAAKEMLFQADRLLAIVREEAQRLA